MASGHAPPSLVLVADDPLWRAHLVQVLLEDGFQVVQRPFPRQPKELVAEAGARLGPRLLILHLSAERQNSASGAVMLLQGLRRRDQAIPLLLLLDAADEEQRAMLLDAGADDVLVQPFGLREFVARCRAILRRAGRQRIAQRSSGSAELLQVGPISLDREQCRVHLNGAELHPGRALSREQLLEQVWGPDYSGDSKSVDVHVLWLRRKLDVAGSRPELFITVRGIGYRLDPPRP
jgi:two-component system phosphate regulon response regulator PhoB